MRVSYLCVLVAMLVAPPSYSALAQETPPAARAPANDAMLDDYRIGPEDVLAISIWKNEPLSRVVSVRPDGMVSLPLLDDLRAAGLTPMQLREELAKKLSEFVPSPTVSVIVNEVRSFKVSVIGEIVRPSRYDLKSRTTMLDVLAMAGGFNQFASRTRIVVLRQDGKKQARIPINYNKIINGEEENLSLRPGDIVIVP